MRQLPTVTKILRTPPERFINVPDFPCQPHYTEVGGLRIAHIDEGPKDAPLVLLMHGEPTWSFLYRKMIPVLVNEGFRVIAPDLVGFGRSDKPAKKKDYSYLNHVMWMTAWLERNELTHISLFCQDWGSLVGLRMVPSAQTVSIASCWLMEACLPAPKKSQLHSKYGVHLHGLARGFRSVASSRRVVLPG